MKSEFIKDVEEFSKDMTERLPATNEGGIIMLAVDNSIDGYALVSIIANKEHTRQLVRSFLSNPDLKQEIIEVLKQGKQLNSKNK